MNNLNVSHNGGHPLTLDDFDFLQAALKDGVKGHLTALSTNSNDVVIISGINLVNIVGSNWAWSDGYVFAFGDIFKVAAGGLTLSGGNVLTWSVNTTYDPAGDDTYEDGSIYHTHEINNLTISQALSTILTPPETTPYYRDVIGKTYDIWHEVGSAGEPAFANGCWSNHSSSQKVSFRKNTDGSVSLRGVLDGTSVALNPVIFTLPVGYRPSEEVYFPISNCFSSPAQFYGLEIKTNGDVFIKNTGTWGDSVSLYGVRFHLDY